MKYTNQSAFDKMVEHLFTQKKPCKEADTVYCYYRGPKGTDLEGLMCAVGALIPDEEYHIGIEDRVASVLVKQFEIPALAGLDAELLVDVQCVHDYSKPKTWHADLKQVAKSHALSTEVLDKYEGVEL